MGRSQRSADSHVANWSPLAVPAAGLLVALCSPADFASGKVQTTPIGALAIAGSFLLFGLDTLAARTKHRWSGGAKS